MNKLVYLAGFLDGDGHFYKPTIINGRGEKHQYIRIIATQARDHNGEPTRVLEWCKDNFGGNVYYYKNGVGRWSLTGSKAKALLIDLLPYLIVKSKQASALL